MPLLRTAILTEVHTILNQYSGMFGMVWNMSRPSLSSFTSLPSLKQSTRNFIEPVAEVVASIKPATTSLSDVKTSLEGLAELHQFGDNLPGYLTRVRAAVAQSLITQLARPGIAAHFTGDNAAENAADFFTALEMADDTPKKAEICRNVALVPALMALRPADTLRVFSPYMDVARFSEFLHAAAAVENPAPALNALLDFSAGNFGPASTTDFEPASATEFGADNEISLGSQSDTAASSSTDVPEPPRPTVRDLSLEDRHRLLKLVIQHTPERLGEYLKCFSDDDRRSLLTFHAEGVESCLLTTSLYYPQALPGLLEDILAQPQTETMALFWRDALKEIFDCQASFNSGRTGQSTPITLFEGFLVSLVSSGMAEANFQALLRIIFTYANDNTAAADRLCAFVSRHRECLAVSTENQLNIFHIAAKHAPRHVPELIKQAGTTPWLLHQLLEQCTQPAGYTPLMNAVVYGHAAVSPLLAALREHPRREAVLQTVGADNHSALTLAVAFKPVAKQINHAMQGKFGVPTGPGDLSMFSPAPAASFSFGNGLGASSSLTVTSLPFPDGSSQFDFGFSSGPQQ